MIMTWVWIYHLDKANTVENALNWLSMGSDALIKDGKRELVYDVHKLAWLGVPLIYSNEGSVMVQNGS